MNGSQNYNPDVLNCLANLSNDEVFTPPELANKMLDLLPQELFQSPNTTFLDPFTKSGVFLREIVKRLDKGLEKLIPDRQERIDHILQKQVFGIAITELTSLLARRSVYCSKDASGKYSISKFPTASGNILYKNISHTWVNGKCKYCGASQAVFDRGSEAEQYAYLFIHSDNFNQLFPNMKFDVIVGNPPYQLVTHSGVKGDQAIPVYHLFVKCAKKLSPNYITIITPARWYNGGMGLNSYRDEMLKDRHLEILCDFPNAKDCFPSTNISGGVCFFLWNNNYKGKCTFINHFGDSEIIQKRYLNEYPTFIRDNRSLEIVEKITSERETTLVNMVSPIMPFGLPSNARGSDTANNYNIYKLYASNGVTYVKKEDIVQRLELVNKYKIALGQLISGHLGEYDENGQTKVFSSLFIMHPKELCTASYLSIGSFETLEECNNAVVYLKSRFVRFFVLQTLTSMHITRSSFSFVPLQDFSHPWTDEMLYKKYGLTEEEIAFIESMIRPME